MKLSLLKFIALALGTLIYLSLGTTGIVYIEPLHSSVILLIFAASVLVTPVCLMWRDIFNNLRPARI